MLGLTALPTAWKVAGFALLALAIAIAFGVVYGKGRSDGSAACKAAAAQAVIKAQQKADALADQLIRTEAAAREATAKTTTIYKDRIVNAPQTNSCGPVLRDARDGVCALIHGDCAPAK